MEADSTLTVSEENQTDTKTHPVLQMLVKIAQTCAETEEKIQNSDKTFHMIPTCLKYSIPKPKKDSYGNYNRDSYSGFGTMDKLKNELFTQKANPIIVCFSDEGRKIPKDSSERTVKTWRESSQSYEAEKIVYHFHGLARVCLPPTERLPFEGIHYEAPVTTSSIIGCDSPSLRLGIGFVKPGEDTLYIVGTSSWMYFEADCLSFGVFDMDKKHASLHMSGWGWQQIVGTPIENDK